MKFRIAIIIFTVLFLGAATFGIIKRTGYSDLNKDPALAGESLVITCDLEELQRTIDLWKNGLPEDKEHDVPAVPGLRGRAAAILAVCCEETPVYRYRCITQKVSVQKVFLGSDIEKGEPLDLVVGSVETPWKSCPELEGRFTLGLTGTNFMIREKIYLVFLSENPLLRPARKTLGFVSGMIRPQFCYEEIMNRPVPLVNTEFGFALFQDGQDNEFFLTSEEAIRFMAEYKAKLLEEYPLTDPAEEKGGAK